MRYPGFPGYPSEINIESPSIQQLDEDLHTQHCVGYPINTPFSSWSQSLALVLVYAKSLENAHTLPHGHATQDLHICVLDTSRLDNRNPIFFTAAQECQKRGLDSTQAKFLAIGVISGPGYRAVKYTDIPQAAAVRVMAAGGTVAGVLATAPVVPVGDIYHQLRNKNVDVDAAIEMATEFGDKFEFPVKRAGRLFERLWERYQAVENVWQVGDGSDRNKTLSAEGRQAMRFMHMFAKRKRDQILSEDVMDVDDTFPAVSAAEGTMDDEDGDGYERDKHRAVEHAMANSTKVSQEVKDLYIDIIGWRPPELVEHEMETRGQQAAEALRPVVSAFGKGEGDAKEQPMAHDSRPTAQQATITRAVRELETEMIGWTPAELAKGSHDGELQDFADSLNKEP